MQKTLHYELKKPEITDQLRVTDFNENSDLIDAALAGKAEKSAVSAVETALANYKTSNDAALANKADTSAITALQTLVGAKGNCKIKWGTYTGTGDYGSKYPNALTFEFKPLLVFVSNGSDAYTLINNVAVIMNANCQVTWGENSVSWYNIYTADTQYNVSGRVYYYVAVGV